MLILLLFLMLVAASFTDIKGRYVDNQMLLASAVTGSLIILGQKGMEGILDGYLSAALVFLVCFPLFCGGLMGAGDVKLLMTVCILVGSDCMKRSLIPLGISAVLLTAFMALTEKRLKNLEIPMAIPISIGVLSAL
ncbi:MAG: A24 family peptidase [Lachnospiraceae bacterium]|nr:A24 family peptidase [Lachnospiraceae bacterium]